MFGTQTHFDAETLFLSLQKSVQEGCKTILVSDYFNLQERLVSLQSRGIAIDSSSVCAFCDQPLMSSQLALKLITFNCKHSYHEQCLPTYNLVSWLLTIQYEVSF